ncbi:MAG: hypothetical protein QXG86_03295 [Candidatus Woesearchaeota archaeon]
MAEKEDLNQKFDSIAQELVNIGKKYKVMQYTDTLIDILYNGGRKENNGYVSFNISPEESKKIAQALSKLQLKQYWCETNGWSPEKLESFISEYAEEKDKITDSTILETLMAPSKIPVGKTLESIIRKLEGRELHAADFFTLGTELSKPYMGALQSLVLRKLEPQTEDPHKKADYIIALQKYTGKQTSDMGELINAFAEKAYEKYGNKK